MLNKIIFFQHQGILIMYKLHCISFILISASLKLSLTIKDQIVYVFFSFHIYILNFILFVQTFEIQDLTEKALVDEKDIAELISKQVSHNLMSYRSFKYTVLSISLIKKNVNCDGFEFIKVGKLFMVRFLACVNRFSILIKISVI